MRSTPPFGRHRAGVAAVVAALVGAVSIAATPVGASDVSPAAGTPIAAAVTTALSSIALSTLTAAPTGGLEAGPRAINDKTLKVDGKPDLLYIGAEFCPYCAAERWALYIALSKFGTFSPQPGRIHSAVTDGNIPTLTFYRTTYTSPYLTFTPKELTTNQPSGNYYVALQKVTAAQQALWKRHSGEVFPWVDFGGKAELTSSQYDPSVLVHRSFTQIAKAMGHNSTTVGADIDASAAVLVRTICTTLSGAKPAAVCNAAGSG